MSETGVIPYDLELPFCPECRRPLGNRWLMTAPSGCGTCDEAITRHRCTGRPERDSMETGESWECPDCGSTWTATEVADQCGECGQETRRKTWEAAEGDRIATAPRHNPVGFTPFRNILPQPGKCHRTPAGIMVHVKPDCRCRRPGMR
jgi:hypothetical protein